VHGPSAIDEFFAVVWQQATIQAPALEANDQSRKLTPTHLDSRVSISRSWCETKGGQLDVKPSRSATASQAPQPNSTHLVMAEQDPSRLDMELGLLEAMYPEQASYTPKARELKFTQSGALLQLRLPESYPEHGFPDVIAANDASKADIRAKTRAAVKELCLIEGEEALDAIIAAFQQVLETNSVTQQMLLDKQSDAADKADASRTVIIWLHHLLALTKRKLALSPTTVSGITKPGYPGIMIFSGPSTAVIDHVNTLKAQNWQAFQVRYEEPELWNFTHGKGVKEVETMAEVVKGVELNDATASGSESGKKQKEELLKAVGIK
jgi:hypothetical protein